MSSSSTKLTKKQWIISIIFGLAFAGFWMIYVAEDYPGAESSGSESAGTGYHDLVKPEVNEAGESVINGMRFKDGEYLGSVE